MLCKKPGTGFAEYQVQEMDVSKYIGIYFTIMGQEKILGIVFLKLVTQGFWGIVLNLFTYKMIYICI